MRLVAFITMLLVFLGAASTGWLWLACICLFLEPVTITVERRRRR